MNSKNCERLVAALATSLAAGLAAVAVRNFGLSMNALRQSQAMAEHYLTITEWATAGAVFAAVNAVALVVGALITKEAPKTLSK